MVAPLALVRNEGVTEKGHKIDGYTTKWWVLRIMGDMKERNACSIFNKNRWMSSQKRKEI